MLDQLSISQDVRDFFMSVVIVGAGHAASQIVSSLRVSDYSGAITIIGNEPYIPYQRPPLSKQVLAGEMLLEDVYLKAPEFYDVAKADLVLDSHVESIDRDQRTVTLSGGDLIAYEHLVLATGARPREITLPGSALDGIFYLRTIEDTNRIRNYFRPGAKLVIIGGGYIGLEVAAVAAKAGLKVTVLEMAERVMNRVVAPIISQFYQDIHSKHGVDIRTNVTISHLEDNGNGHVGAVICGNDESVEADFVVVGIGGIPNTELAAVAGLAVDNGIIVDEYARTDDPTIFAVGDCTNHPNGIYQRRIRLESVQNASDQATAAANTICGKPEPYCAVPWFWSDQYDIKLQIAGLSQGYEQTVLRGDPKSAVFSVIYLKDGVLLAVDAVNNPRDFIQAKKLVAARVRPDPAVIADISIKLKDLF